MILELLAKGGLLGLAIAAPVGPIGVLCINRTLERGLAAGVAGGLGTALADGLYALLAAGGFAAFAGTRAAIDLPLRLLGGAFMLWLAVKAMRSRPASAAARVETRNLLGTTAATFLLTLANPATILSFAAVFAGLGLAAGPGLAAVLPLVAGVFAGSMLWWFILSGGVTLARHRLPEAFATWISRLSGLVLGGFGLWALASALA
jgi:putative LysE/RhtB family amino acid efflux pump